MSIAFFLHQVSPYVLEKLKFYPGVVDLFLDSYTLKDYSNNYWKGIKTLQEDWESIDEFLGEQERITYEIYEQIKADLPQIIADGLKSGLWIGGSDSFDWHDNEGLASIEIGNDNYYGKMSYLTPEQVRVMTEKLQQIIKKRNFREAYKVFYPQSLEPGADEEADFWEQINERLAFCQQAVDAGNAIILSCS